MHPPQRRSLLQLLIVLNAAGAISACSPTLNTMLPAKTTPPGHVQVTGGLGGNLLAGEPIDTLKALSDIGSLKTIDPEKARRLGNGTAVFFAQPPGLNSYLSLAYGLNRRFEVGARASIDSVLGWTRWQFMRARPGWYGALGLGLGTALTNASLEAFTNLAQTDSFSRHEVHMPLLFGYSSPILHVWTGPKFIFADYHVRVSVCPNIGSEKCLVQGTSRASGTASYLGGQLGLAIGYRRFWVAVEASIMRTHVTADLAVDIEDVYEQFHFSDTGWSFSPAIGLIVWL
jgi:hypothetical protein